ncbi:hypothetical protein KEM54_003835 [Ascosphaera aggregata]|nr:hypothetical protein KEM54_003835 [Ascosphaera aggregata]
MGIRALKKTLGILLASITKKEFPSFRADVNTQLASYRNELESLGAARHMEKQQMLFLGGIAEKFQELVRSALSCHYADPLFNLKKESRLLTYIANLSEVYADCFEKAGSSYLFMKPGDDHYYANHAKEETLDSKSEASCWRPTDLSEQSRFLSDVNLEEFAELNLLVDSTRFEEIEEPMPNIMQWIEGHYLSSRDLDLGTVSGKVMAGAFREQSKKWLEITKIYMSHAIVIIHRFFNLAFEHACCDLQVREALWSRLSDDIIARYKAAMKTAEFLETLERRSLPFTMNLEFTRFLRSLMSRRTHKLLSSNEDQNMTIDSITSLFMNKTALEHVKEQIHDIMHSYYDIARKRFVDNVYQQAVNHCLISGPDSPLRVFTQQWVMDLSTEDLDEIAGESAFTRERRTTLEKKIQELEEALRILR